MIRKTLAGGPMPFAKTEPLRRELAEALPERGFTVRFWDGTELPATTGNATPVGATNGNARPGTGSAHPGTGNGRGDQRDANNGSDTQRAAPTFTVRSPKAVAHVVRAPGELGLGRAYVAGDLEVDDLDGVIDLIDTFEEPEIDRA